MNIASQRTRTTAQCLRAWLSLPLGYAVEVDEETDNIIIKSPQFGFCVTGVWCRDHTLGQTLAASRTLLAMLVETTTERPEVRPQSIYTHDEIARQRSEPTAWDK